MQIIRGKQPGAKKTVVYGPEGIGKSTLVSKFPDAVFIDTEGSTKDMDVARTQAPSSWTMLMEQARYLINNRVCKTIIIDTADWAEILCTNHVCDKNHKDSIEAFGYGKGYIYVQEEFGRLLNLLEDATKQGINVVFTAHAKMRKFEQPDEMGAYDRWEMKLSKNVAPLVKEWADMVLFCNYKTMVVNVDGQGAQKGKNKVQGGRRVMYTSHHPCWDAKNRYNLPEECDLDYNVIKHIIEIPESKNKQTVQVQVAPPAQTAAPKIPDMEIPEHVDEEVEFHTKAEKKAKIPETFKLPDSIPFALRDLMEVNLVSEEEIQKVVANKGYFPIDTPISNYPEEFVNGVLVGAWQQVYKCIRELRESYVTPFN